MGLTRIPAHLSFRVAGLEATEEKWLIVDFGAHDVL
jgi:hypothetical protein